MLVLLQPSSAVSLWGCDRDICELVLLVVLDVTLVLTWARCVWVEFFWDFFKEEILGFQMQVAWPFLESSLLAHISVACLSLQFLLKLLVLV